MIRNVCKVEKHLKLDHRKRCSPILSCIAFQSGSSQTHANVFPPLASDPRFMSVQEHFLPRQRVNQIPHLTKMLSTLSCISAAPQNLCVHCVK